MGLGPPPQPEIARVASVQRKKPVRRVRSCGGVCRETGRRGQGGRAAWYGMGCERSCEATWMEVTVLMVSAAFWGEPARAMLEGRMEQLAYSARG